jgi:glycosyltransferase involved in cell wall biosynthesis
MMTVPPPLMVFHHPRPIEAVPRAGSAAHVTRMVEAFREIGYEVIEVAGFSSERRRAARSVLASVDRGRVISFVYSEASTIPTSLNDPHHLPLRPLMDPVFLYRLRRRGVPVGLFYPDVYWRFPLYRDAVGPLKRWPANAMYRWDLLWYQRVVDVLFLPSERMAAAVPGWEDSRQVVALAPGGNFQPLAWRPTEGRLKLFYVGSVHPPLYDLTPLLSAVRAVEGVHLTVCCPAEQSSVVDGLASHERITVVHEYGDALIDRYAACDAACLVFAPDSYRDFAMPIKLFEAISAGRPVLASADTAVGDFVERAGVGWTSDSELLPILLQQLVESPQLLQARHDIVVAQQTRHTWAERANLVAEHLRKQSASGVR